MYNSIAIIDTTINFKKNNNIDIFKIDENNNIVLHNHVVHQETPYTHAAVCAAIIKKHAPKAKIINISILDDDRLTCDINKLIHALKWCLDNKLGIISLSVGSTNLLDYDELLSICERAKRNHVNIIAAQNNNRKYTLPASFPQVIGVKNNVNYMENQYSITENAFTGIDVEACSNHLLRDSTGSIFFTETCNSYAAPFIAAKVFNILLEKNISVVNKHEIMELLKEDAYCIGEKEGKPEFTISYFKNQLVLNANNGNGMISFERYHEAINKEKYINITANCLENIPIVKISLLLHHKNKYILELLISELVKNHYFISVISDEVECLKDNSNLVYPRGISKNSFCRMVGYIFSPDILITLSNDVKQIFDVALHYDDNLIALEEQGKKLGVFSIGDTEKCVNYLMKLLQEGV